MVKTHLVRIPPPKPDPLPPHGPVVRFRRAEFSSWETPQGSFRIGQRLSKGSGSMELFLQGLRKSPGSPEKNGDENPSPWLKMDVSWGEGAEGGNRSTRGKWVKVRDLEEHVQLHKSLGDPPCHKAQPNFNLARCLPGKNSHSHVPEPV